MKVAAREAHAMGTLQAAVLALLATTSALTAPPRRVRRVGARLHAERRLEQLSNALKAPQPRRSYAPPGEFYECGTLDSKSFDAPEGDRSLSRTVSVVAAYLAYPAVVAVLSRIPPPNAVEGGYLCGIQIFNPTSMCAYATVSTQDLRLCFENSTRAIDSSKNQPNRLRFDRDREV